MRLLVRHVTNLKLDCPQVRSQGEVGPVERPPSQSH